MNTQLIDSNKKKLSPEDILVIAAHHYKAGINTIKNIPSHGKGISPERVMHTIFVKEVSDPSVIRLRQGNSLYSVFPAEERIAFLHAYNGDTYKNYVDNTAKVFEAMYKLGFNYLVVPTLNHRNPVIDAAYSKYKNKDTHIEKKDGVETIVLGKIRK